MKLNTDPSAGRILDTILLFSHSKDQSIKHRELNPGMLRFALALHALALCQLGAAATTLLEIGHHTQQRRRLGNNTASTGETTTTGNLDGADCGTETIPQQLIRLENSIPTGRCICNWTGTNDGGTWFYYPQVGLCKFETSYSIVGISQCILTAGLRRNHKQGGGIYLPSLEREQYGEAYLLLQRIPGSFCSLGQSKYALRGTY